jgi:ATP phosphoribosyltransferase-like protein
VPQTGHRPGCDRASRRRRQLLHEPDEHVDVVGLAELTRRYDELSEQYGMRATRNNPGASHENGSIEARQGTVKHALNQALLLRGSRNFAQLSDYRSFVAEVATRLNARVIKALTIERACLQPLPRRRTSDYEEVDARVTKFALIAVKSTTYSVPSRLVGHRLKIRLYEDRIEGYLGEHCVLEAPRLRRTTVNPHPRHVDFRHVLPALKRPTISTLSEDGWLAVNTILDESTVRTIIPRLKEAGAQGIVEYPLNKIIM